jgi:hypothetical protein
MLCNSSAGPFSLIPLSGKDVNQNEGKIHIFDKKKRAPLVLNNKEGFLNRNA